MLDDFEEGGGCVPAWGGVRGLRQRERVGKVESGHGDAEVPTWTTQVAGLAKIQYHEGKTAGAILRKPLR